MSTLIVKVSYNPIDYTNIKKNIQAWIDSDATNNGKLKEVTQKQVINKETVKEEPQKTLEKSIDVVLVSGNAAKAIYVDDNNGEKIFNLLDG